MVFCLVQWRSSLQLRLLNSSGSYMNPLHPPSHVPHDSVAVLFDSNHKTWQRDISLSERSTRVKRIQFPVTPPNYQGNIYSLAQNSFILNPYDDGRDLSYKQGYKRIPWAQSAQKPHQKRFYLRDRFATLSFLSTSTTPHLFAHSWVWPAFVQQPFYEHSELFMGLSGPALRVFVHVSYPLSDQPPSAHFPLTLEPAQKPAVFWHHNLSRVFYPHVLTTPLSSDLDQI